MASWPGRATAQLDAALAAAADPATRDHWTGYLKGQAIFRGVPMHKVRRAVRAVWRDHALAARPVDEVLTLALDARAANIVTDDRLAHTGPGWLLRELSKAEPAAVAAFVDAHPQLSREATRMATAHLREGPYRCR